MPFDSTNDIDYIIIQSTFNEQTGQFILPKSVLIKQDYMSRNGVSKKRAMRVYPPWEKPKSAQALKTQAWQIPYWTDIAPVVDSKHLHNLINL
jgi:hypothetical protein